MKLFLIAALCLSPAMLQAQLVTRYDAAVTPNNPQAIVVLTENTSNSWTGGNPGSPVFSVSGGCGASITAQQIVTGSPDEALLLINTGTCTGILTFTDTSSRGRSAGPPRGSRGRSAGPPRGPDKSYTTTMPVRLPITYYTLPGGGTRYDPTLNPTGQCNGKYNVTYAAVGRSGTNQNCGFGDVRSFWTTGNNTYCADSSPSSNCWFWVGAGGDNFLIMNNTANSGYWTVGQNGPNSGDFYGLAGDPHRSGIPSPNSGSPTYHTTIYGQNHGACAAQSSRTGIQGAYSVSPVISFAAVTYVGSYVGTFYIDVACLDITDFSSCGQSSQTSTCNSNYPLTNYAGSGIGWGNGSSNITVTDVRVHGMSATGMSGPTGDGNHMVNLDLIGNAGAGWNADNGAGNQNALGVGDTYITKFNFSWNGCAEEYPIVDTLPYSDCTDDGIGGYGDAFGTATVNNTQGGWHLHFDQGVTSYNTQDGLDALHLTGDGSTMTITRVLSYGNMGQQLKIGGSGGTAINNIIFTNCNALRQAIPGTPTSLTTYPITGYSIAQPNGPGTTATYTFTFSGAVPPVGSNIGLRDFTGSDSGLSYAAMKVTSVTSTTASGLLYTASPQAFTATTGNAIVSWNSGLSDFCRAADSGMALAVQSGATLTIQYNTFYCASVTCAEINNGGDNTMLIDYRNNLFLGFQNNSTNGYPKGGSGNFSNPIYNSITPNPFTNPGSFYANNSTFNASSSWTCPNTGWVELNAVCVDPHLTTETPFPVYGTVNVAPLPGSPVIGAGTPVSTNIDFNGKARDPAHPTIGAIEGGGTTTPTYISPGPWVIMMGFDNQMLK